MKITIYVEQEVEIPDEQLLDFAQQINDKFRQADDTPVHAEDMVNHAIGRGLISLRNPWRLKDDDDCYTLDELRELSRSASKKRGKK
jgi:hypothetical protein